MHRGITAAAAVALLGLAGVVGAAKLGPGSGLASSHREAPLIAEDPAADLTDLYAFRSPDKPNTVTIRCGASARAVSSRFFSASSVCA